MNRHISDPEDIRARIDALRARAHIDADAYLEALRAVPTWSATPEPIQDLAIAEAARRTPQLRHVITRSFECQVRASSWGAVAPVDDEQLLLLERLGMTEALDGLLREASDGLLTVHHRIGVFRQVETGMRLALIPGATTPSQRGPRDQERLVEAAETGARSSGGTVQEPVVAPFFIGRYPALNRELHPNPRGVFGAEALPVTGLGSDGAAGVLERHGLRLPSEAEWGHAARGGARSAPPWGRAPADLNRYVWSAGNRPATEQRHIAAQATAPVEQGDRVALGDDGHLQRAGRGFDSHALGVVERVMGESEDGRLRAVHVALFESRPGPVVPPHIHDATRAWNPFGLVDMIGNVWERDDLGRLYGGSARTVDILAACSGVSRASGEPLGLRAALSIRRKE